MTKMREKAWEACRMQPARSGRSEGLTVGPSHGAKATQQNVDMHTVRYRKTYSVIAGSRLNH